MSQSASVITIGEFDPTAKTGLVFDRNILNGFGIEPAMLISAIRLNEMESAPVGGQTLNNQLHNFACPPAMRHVKTGKLGRRENVEIVTSYFEDQDMARINFVVDASVDAGEDRPLLKSSAMSLVRMRLLPLANIVIAYLSEAARLANIEVTNISQMKEAAEAIHMYGARAVLVRSDRQVDDEWVDILFEGEEHQFLFRKTAQPPDVRAGRDTFASALVAYMAQGKALRDSIEQAQQFASRALSVRRGRPA